MSDGLTSYGSELSDHVDTGFVSHYLNGAKHGATCFVVYFSRSPEETLRSARGFSLVTKTAPRRHNAFGSENRIDTRRSNDAGQRVFRDVKGDFILAPLGTDGAHILITREPSDYVRDALRRLIYRSRLSSCLMRLTSEEIRAVLESLLGHRQGKLTIRRAVARTVREESIISHEKTTLSEVYDEAERQKRRIHSLSFAFVSHTGEVLLKAGISRDGHIVYRDGSLPLFVDTIVAGAAKIVRERTKKLEGRERSQKTGEVKPLRLIFNDPVFTEKADVLSFLDVVRKIPHGEFTLYHRNPYLHLGYFDFFDASEFDVFIDGPNSIMLVPQFKASVPSLFRFCQKIFEHFEEGAIEQLNESGVAS